jgi:hypothetical protein
VVNGCKKNTVFTCAEIRLSPTLSWPGSFLSDERVACAAAIVVVNSNGRMINITGLPVDLIRSQVFHWSYPPGKAKKMAGNIPDNESFSNLNFGVRISTGSRFLKNRNNYSFVF